MVSGAYPGAKSYGAEESGEPSCGQVVENPSFIVAVHWTRHLWHLLFDLLQPVYNMMHRAYGVQTRDVRFWVLREERDADTPQEARSPYTEEGKGKGSNDTISMNLEEELQLAEIFDRPIRMMRLFR